MSVRRRLENLEGHFGRDPREVFEVAIVLIGQGDLELLKQLPKVSRDWLTFGAAYQRAEVGAAVRIVRLDIAAEVEARRRKGLLSQNVAVEKKQSD